MRDGTLSDESMRRFVHGLELYKRGLAPTIVLLGPPRTDVVTAPEAEVRWEIARNFGVPGNAVIRIPDAYTTREEALLTSDALRTRNAGRILLVTESVHMKRAKRVFEKNGFVVLPGSWDYHAATAASASHRLFLSLRIAEETLALVYYRLAGYI